MSLQDIEYNDDWRRAVGEDVHDEEYLSDDNEDDNEEGFVQAEQTQASSTQEPEEGGELPTDANQLFDEESEGEDDRPVALDSMYGDELDVQDDIQSHFSGTSSDEDGWAAEEMQRIRAGTAAIVSRQRAGETPDDADEANEADSEHGMQEQEDSPEEGNTEPAAARPEVYEIDETKKPWLHNTHLNGALLPIAGYGGDDLYRRDAIFFHTGRPDPTRGAGPVGLARGKPTNMSFEGVLSRIKRQRNELKSELEDNAEEIGMLRHAVDTRDERLKQYRDSVEAWKQHSEQWQKAFEQQQPLAHAERERKMMVEAGVEVQRSVETQTLPIPVDIANQPKIPDPGQSTHTATQTDADIPDPDDILALCRERDDLLEENKELSDQARRLHTLLENMKAWIETQHWTPKDSVVETHADAIGKSQPIANISRPSSNLSTPQSDNGFSETLLPVDWESQGRPERWIEREQGIRKSASWIQARDECAALLDAWEKQFWASTNAEAAVCG